MSHTLLILKIYTFLRCSNDVEIIFWLSLLVSDFQKSVLQCSIHSCSLSLSYSALQFLIAGYIFVLLWILVWMTLPALCLVGRVDWQTMCLTGEKVANLNQSIWTCMIISCTYIVFFCIIYNLQAILWYLKLGF